MDEDSLWLSTVDATTDQSQFVNYGRGFVVVVDRRRQEGDEVAAAARDTLSPRHTAHNRCRSAAVTVVDVLLVDAWTLSDEQCCAKSGRDDAYTGRLNDFMVANLLDSGRHRHPLCTLTSKQGCHQAMELLFDSTSNFTA